MKKTKSSKKIVLKITMSMTMDMVIFRKIFFELLVFFTFTLLTFHFTY